MGDYLNVMLSVIMLNIVKLSVFMLNVVILSVVMLNIVMLSIAASSDVLSGPKKTSPGQRWSGFSSKRLFIEAAFHRSGFSSKQLFIKGDALEVLQKFCLQF